MYRLRTMDAKLYSLALLLLSATLGAADTPVAKQILVLDNENLLEGQIERDGPGYRVRREGGGELTVPASRVLALVEDRQAAFVVVSKRANRGDADERLRLARWCFSNGLRTEAAEEARTAAKMRPGFAAAERFAASLEQIAAQPKPMVDPAVVQAKAETKAPDKVADVPVVEYNSESFPLFASKVNTILNNTCANCHAQDSAKKMKLTRQGGRAGASKNLMAVLPYVNAKNPAASPLLVKAITPHGTSTLAPFKTRNHPAYETLEIWTHFARAPEGTLEPYYPLPQVEEPMKLPPLSLPEAKEVSTPRPGAVFGKDSTTVPTKPVKKVASDPFDPAIFNGEVPRK